ncbi:hypothetical protein M3Y99_00602500 [Aphelenchoides fujianensis]|nr:hypothetical protein M3Y99_00602500 [Aphelenchoides fujianensis]
MSAESHDFFHPPASFELAAPSTIGELTHDLDGMKEEEEDAENRPPPFVIATQSNAKYTCPQCGINCFSNRKLKSHLAGHQRAAGWSCSVCDVKLANATRRNQHEEAFHNFTRPFSDLKLREGVRISKHRLQNVLNLGRTFLDVQSSAQASLSTIPADSQQVTLADMLRALNTTDRKLPRFQCKTCGIFSVTLGSRKTHERQHAVAEGFICSVCGIKRPTASARNQHEKAVHRFVRAEGDRAKEAPAVVSTDQRNELRNVGFNFEDVQEEARLNAPPPPPPPPEAPKRAAERTAELTAKFAQLDVRSAKDRRQRRRALTPDTAHRPQRTAARRSGSVEKPPNGSNRPKRRESIASPRVTARTQQPLVPRSRPSVGSIDSEADKLLAALWEHPAVLYYDFYLLSPKFNAFPAYAWKNSKESKLLVLRVPSLDAIDYLRLDFEFFSGELSDGAGWIVAFVKQRGARIGIQFTEHARPSMRWREIMAVLKAMDARTLVVLSSADADSIRALESERFVIF